MKIAVTGTTGYLGGFLVQSLLESGKHEILSITRRANSLFEGKTHFKELLLGAEDRADTVRAITDFAPDAIIHVAAMTATSKCEEQPSLAEAANVGLTELVRDAGKESGCYVCMVSTDLVFDGAIAPEGGFAEDALPTPLSVYACTKHRAEQLILDSNPDWGVMRTSLLYGPSIGTQRGTLAWMEDGFQSLTSITLFEDEFRTPVYVDDAVACLCAMFEHRGSGLYHCAGSERVSRVEFGMEYARCFEFSPALIKSARRSDIPSVPPRPADVSLSTGRARSELGVTFRSPAEAFAFMSTQSESPGA